MPIALGSDGGFGSQPFSRHHARYPLRRVTMRALSREQVPHVQVLLAYTARAAIAGKQERFKGHREGHDSGLGAAVAGYPDRLPALPAIRSPLALVDGAPGAAVVGPKGDSHDGRFWPRAGAPSIDFVGTLLTAALHPQRLLSSK